MRRRDDGGPAFPTLYLNGSDGSQFQSTDGGMTLRDYFAAKAMAAFIGSYKNGEVDDFGAVVLDSWDMADQMLKERAK